MSSQVKAASAASTDGGNGTFSLGVIAATLLCAAAFLGIGASAAGAATAGQSYGDSGATIGTPDACCSDVNSISVSEDDGNVFIARRAESSIDIIDPAGVSLARPTTVSAPLSVGTSADGGYFFIKTDGNALQKYVRTGSSPPSYAQEPLWTPGTSFTDIKGLAVDPSTGDLLLSDGPSVKRLDAETGQLLATYIGNGPGAFQNPRSIALASSGDIYVTDAGSVEHLAADGTSKGQLPKIAPYSRPAVNPSSGLLARLVSGGGESTFNESVIEFFSPANQNTGRIVVPDALAAASRGLAFSPDGLRLYIGLEDGSAVVYTLATQPGVDAPVASAVTPESAHVEANIATGGELTTARIEYCLASDPCERYLAPGESSPWHQLTDHKGLSSSPGQDTIDGDLTGLEPNTKYLLRTYAVNEGNKVENRSATALLNTAVPPPLVTTAVASDITDSSAALNGSVDNTFGSQTTFHFEYGTSAEGPDAYGSTIPVPDGVAGNLRTSRVFARIVKGLQPETTYHFRLVATNSGGTSFGDDRTFTTLGPDQLPPVRGYEQVTPTDKNGLVLQPGAEYLPSPDGAIQYSGNGPSADALSQGILSKYVSRRSAVGWGAPHPTDPPLLPSRTIIVTTTLGLSDDYKHALVVSQVALAPGATQGAGNLYIKDLDTGAFQFVASSNEVGTFLSFAGTTTFDKFIAAAPDMSWVVFNAARRMGPGIPAEVPKVAMYKWSQDDGLTLVSLLPDGSIPVGTVHLQGSTVITNRMVSDDGNTIVFSLDAGPDAGVYRRVDSQTKAVSVGRATGGPVGVQPAIADAISRDGRFVVFHTEAMLTDADEDGGGSEYRFDSESDQLEYLGPKNQDGDGMANVPWIAEDAGIVYFDSLDKLVVWREGQPGLDEVNPSAILGGAFGSPNGQFFAYQRNGALYLYDALAGNAECMSCRPDGTPASASLPQPERYISNRVPQAVTDDGHAYFTTDAALLAVDRNSASDVYEYFRGRLTLVSPGNSDNGATLFGISADATDVFFSTAQGLVAQDTDRDYDVYDARIGGGIAAQNAAPLGPPCTADACQGAGSPEPAPISPGSSRSGGGGNQSQSNSPRCRRNQHRVKRGVKVRCVKKRAHTKRDAKHNRGANR